LNQIKIGKFIASKRKENNLTQIQLADKLGVTDRAVSKWENGKSLPDASIMLDLCQILQITVNDLLSGEVVSMDKYNKEMENKLIEMAKQKQQADKRLLSLEIFVGVLLTIVMFTLIVIASFVQMKDWLRVVLILIGFIPFLIAAPFMIRIEQIAGYYQCQNCGHKYVPKYNSVFWAMHMGRTRYMKCPNCGKRSWQKKILTKDE